MVTRNQRRVRLPGAAELFRPTTVPEPVQEPARAPDRATESELDLGLDAMVVPAPARTVPRPDLRDAGARVTGRSSGRRRHDEKITVYLSADELLDLEHARLTLRATYGITVDRGRLVRESVAELLADFREAGEASILYKRLTNPS